VNTGELRVRSQPGLSSKTLYKKKKRKKKQAKINKKQ
jgi:hypothetical protein